MEGIVKATPPTLPAGTTDYSSVTTAGGTRVQPQDGAGNDVSASHPFPVGGTVSVSGTTTVAGSVSAPLSPLITGPTSILTRPANTTAYAQNESIANSTTAASVVEPSFNIANSGGAAAIPALCLTTNVTTGWDQAVLRVRLWSAAPTFSNGDGGAYAVLTGAAGFLGSMDITLNQFGDGASGVGAPAAGSALWAKLAADTAIFWDIECVGTAALTPISGQTFTLTPVVSN